MEQADHQSGYNARQNGECDRQEVGLLGQLDAGVAAVLANLGVIIDAVVQRGVQRCLRTTADPRVGRG